MERITVDRTPDSVPEWAVLERRLLETLGEATDPVLDRYVADDGSLLWPPDDYEGIDGLDDAYESFYNWPLAYLLGGDGALLRAAKREWEAITEQFASVPSGNGHPMVVKEYEQGRDWFHQGEGNLLLYNICMADPTDEAFRERAARFAGFYLNEDPDVPDLYDEEHRLLKSPQLGSAGPAYRNFRDSELNPMNYQEWMNGYGLPFHDVPGVDTVDDLRDPECARRMGAAMEERCARGDVPGNIGATGLVTNAYLLTGADRFRGWVLEYADAWLDRIDANDGIIPDSVGPSGEIGECIDGKWWGGYYGWTWPHGFHDFAGPLTIGARNARLLGDDPGRLDLLRSQFDVLDDREIGDDDRRYRPQKHGDPEGMPDGGAGDDVLRAADGTVHTEGGWSHYAPGGETAARTHLWHASMEPADRERVSRLGEHDPTEPIEPAWGKWVGGHQRAWLSYLDGDRPSYPESILSTNLAQVNERLRTLREDDPETAVKEAEEAYLQLRNPVVTEGLVHCTLGGPQLIYYGGLQRGRVRHFDADRRRPGLPEDVAVLVTDLKPDRTVVEVVNVGDTERSLVVQAGTFAQHRFGRVTYDTSGGRRGVANIDGDAFALDLDVGAATRIEAETDRFVGDPTYAAPWDR